MTLRVLHVNEVNKGLITHLSKGVPPDSKYFNNLTMFVYSEDEPDFSNEMLTWYEFAAAYRVAKPTGPTTNIIVRKT